MQVFCLELVSTGYFAGRIPDSFVREGNAMLRAVIDDMLRIPGVTVSTILAADQRETPVPAGSETAWFQPGNRLEPLVREFADQAAATLIIAPEFDELLERFCLAAVSPRVLSLNCDQPTLRLCADKLELARRLTSQRIPTLPTKCQSLSAPPPEFPCVVKPRLGAGSWLVRLVRQTVDWAAILSEYRQARLDQLLVQPYIAGQSLSIAAMRQNPDGTEVLPVAEQSLTGDGTFQYQGGSLPAGIDSASVRSVQQLAKRALDTIPGWSGYVGLDILIPDDDPQTPLVVEINPRLTTSYLGYRRNCQENLMERLLFPTRFPEPLRWKQQRLSFTPDDHLL